MKATGGLEACSTGTWAAVAAPTPKNELVAAVPEPAGANCAAGGQAIKTGMDANGNGTLDPSEVTSTQYVCNGTVGLTISSTWRYELAGSPGAINLEGEGANTKNYAYLVDVRLYEFSDGSGFVSASGINSVYVSATDTVSTPFANAFLVPSAAQHVVDGAYPSFSLCGVVDPNSKECESFITYSVTLGAPPTLQAVVDGANVNTSIPLSQGMN